ncbi:MAG: tRNA (N6-isopentenyl adenosine(37)-C2)-methylthiotransferase MiaB [Pyrinomonadaceae bacterium]
MKKTSVYIETFGCQMNVADTERASTGLRRAGYELTGEAEEADVVLLNTCSIRARAEAKVYSRVGGVKHRARKSGQLIGVMGCVAQLEGEAVFDHAPSVGLVAGTQATDRLPALIERARAGEKKVLDLGEREAGEIWEVSPVERHSPYVAFVPIIEGCNKFCSYCIVPFSRGRERSRPAAEVIDEVKRLKDAGFSEVHLLGQNVNSYRPRPPVGLENFDGATPFSKLLRAVAATGMERIKFTTSFPRDFHHDIVAAIDENPNLCNWVHLPAQSGNDRVLRQMRRGHKVADYLERIRTIKNARRRIALTSDMIVGFPGETAEEVMDTVSLVEQCQYDSLYIFKYSPRARTPAAAMSDTISEEEKSERFEKVEEAQKRIQKTLYSSYLGEVVNVLVERRSTRSELDLMGHSTCHKIVNFRGSDALIGRTVDVRITEVKSNSLYGEAAQSLLKAFC